MSSDKVARPAATPGFVSRFLPGPCSLAARPEEFLAAAACIGLLLLVFLGNLLTPVQVAIGALGLLPLLAACWLLSDRLALAVAVVATGQLVLTAALGAITVATAVAEVTAYIVLGLVVRLYAGSIAELIRRPVVREPQQRNGAIGVASLTRREREVARLAAQGYTAREIGEMLHIGERTVETHVANICSKLGVKAKAELVRVGSRFGF